LSFLCKATEPVGATLSVLVLNTKSENMKKSFIFFTVVLALTMAFVVPYSKIEDLKREKQGWVEHFELLNKRIAYQEETISEINSKLANDYKPFIKNSFDVYTTYGIGGSDYAIQFSPELTKLIENNYKEVKIAQAYAAVVMDRMERTMEVAKRVKDSLKHTPSIRPVPLDSVHTISSFGLRLHPILHVLKMHEGIDYGCLIGTPVYATADGIVVFSGYDPITGQYIKIEHGYGYTTLYGHLSRRLVVKGEKVHKGQLIGFTGNSGRSVGPHLHYEVRVYGTQVNPVLFIPDPIPAEIESLHSKRSRSYLIAR
jgi:murein DD-endopeptidase MepM/ murein hydrolase activator NlpD